MHWARVTPGGSGRSAMAKLLAEASMAMAPFSSLSEVLGRLETTVFHGSPSPARSKRSSSSSARSLVDVAQRVPRGRRASPRRESAASRGPGATGIVSAGRKSAARLEALARRGRKGSPSPGPAPGPASRSTAGQLTGSFAQLASATSVLPCFT